MPRPPIVLAAITLASVLLATAPRAQAARSSGSQPSGSGGAESDLWGVVMAGVQSADGFGGELSVLRFDSSGRVLEGGYGLVAGGTEGTGYFEAEGVLTVTPRSNGAPDIWIFKTLLTASAGPVVRWRGGVLGVQATVSAAVMFVPIIVFVRPRMFLDESGADVVFGAMFKIPLWGKD
jgi:hypothetical protein